MITSMPPDEGWTEGHQHLRGVERIDEAIALITSARAPQGVHLQVDDLVSAWDLFCRRFVLVQAAGGTVMDEKGRLLAIRRLGVWDLPKGKVDRDEAIDAAAVREVREECGVQHLRLVRHLTTSWHTYDRKGRAHLKCTEWYLMLGSSADALQPQLEEDIEEVAWLDAAGVARMKADTYPSLLPVIAAWEALR